MTQKVVEVLLSKIGGEFSVGLQEKCLSVIASIAGASHACRDQLLELGTHERIFLASNKDQLLVLQSGLARTTAKLFQGIPTPSFGFTLPALPLLVHFLRTVEELVVLEDVCKAIDDVTREYDQEQIQRVILDTGICASLLRLIRNGTFPLKSLCLSILGTFSTGTEAHTEMFVASGCLPILKELLDNYDTDKKLTKVACWIVSNIASQFSMVQALLDTGVIDSLFLQMHFADEGIRKEVIWALTNALSNCNPKQTAELVKKDCIKYLSEFVCNLDERIVSISLEGFGNILSHGELLKPENNQINPYAEIVEREGGLDRIESLQAHVNELIFKKSSELIERFFWSEEDALEDINQDPGNGFVF